MTELKEKEFDLWDRQTDTHTHIQRERHARAHTHTHTHTQREREREREIGNASLIIRRYTVIAHKALTVSTYKTIFTHYRCCWLSTPGLSKLKLFKMDVFYLRLHQILGSNDKITRIAFKDNDKLFVKVVKKVFDIRHIAGVDYHEETRKVKERNIESVLKLLKMVSMPTKNISKFVCVCVCVWLCICSSLCLPERLSICLFTLSPCLRFILHILNRCPVFDRSKTRAGRWYQTEWFNQRVSVILHESENPRVQNGYEWRPAGWQLPDVDQQNTSSGFWYQQFRFRLQESIGVWGHSG